MFTFKSIRFAATVSLFRLSEHLFRLSEHLSDSHVGMAVLPNPTFSPNPSPLVPPPFPISDLTSKNPRSAPNPISSSLLSSDFPHRSSDLPPPPTSSSNPNPAPVPPISYAQVTKSSRGPGFVRSHASAVESFARLPRTGVNIICGSREGIPSFSFVSSDLPTVEELYSNALVMKFHGGRPSLEISHKEIQSWGLEHPFSIGPLTSRAFLLRFQDNKDLIRVLSRPSTLLITYPYKVFRWHNLCHLKEDSCYAPVWISLPRLPLQCFIPEFLESVANKIGRFLCFDKATTTLARPSAARLCVEIDLRKPPPPFIWVGLFDGLEQPIIYEKLPKFCNKCQVQGHLVADCPKGQRETPNFQAAARSKPIRERTQPVRQNATMHSSTLLQQSNILSATPSIPNPPQPVNPLLPSVSDPSAAHNHSANVDAEESRQQHTVQVAIIDQAQHSGEPVRPAPTPYEAPMSLQHQSNSFPPSHTLVQTPHQIPISSAAFGSELQLVDNGSATTSCSHNVVASKEKDDQVSLKSDESTSQSLGPPGFCTNNNNLHEVNPCIEDNSSQSSGPPGFNIKIPKTKKKHTSKGGSVFSHRTHLKHFASSKRSSSTSKRDNSNPTTHLPINSLSSEELANIASNCGIKLPLSAADVARMKALEIERSRAAP